VYQISRFGNFTYTFTNLPSGLYSVRLHFCETYWTAAGSRTFNTFINGTQVLTNFDIWSAAGGLNWATIRQFTTTANSTNAIVIQFVTTKDNAQVNGIEILPILPPSTPTGISATPGNAQVILNWTVSAGAASYNVKRSASPGAEVTITNVASTSFTDFSVTNGTAYYYVVTGVGTGGESPPPAEVTATPVNPLTPFQLWQMQYFGSTNNPLAAPDADASGTGQNNLFKYTAGLNPTNPASVFVLQIGAISNGPCLTFGPIASNRIYNLQTRPDLLTGNWSVLTGTATPVTNGNQIKVTDTNAASSPKYYRVGITLP
jgi:hypothetical protein